MFWSYLLEFALAVVLVAGQHTWPSWLKFVEQGPDLAVVLLVSVGLTRGATEGCWTGLSTGLLVGALGKLPLGGIFVSHIGAGTALGLLRGRIFPEQVSVAMLVTVVAVIATNTVELIFLPPSHFLPWLAATFGQAVLSGIVAAPLFIALRALFGYLPKPPAER